MPQRKLKSKLNVGRIVRQAREARGWTWYQLAHRSGVSQQQVTRIEAGECSPSVTTLEKLAVALGGRLVVEIEIPERVKG